MATASFGRTMSEDSLLFWIRADQGRTGIRQLPDRYRVAAVGSALMATAFCGRAMLGTSLLSSIRADQGRTGIRQRPDRYRVAAVGSGIDGDCVLWSGDVGDFVIILDPGGSGANRDPAAAGPLPGGSRRVGHRWRLRFVVGRCRGLRYFPDPGGQGQSPLPSSRLRDERCKRSSVGITRSVAGS